MNLMIYSDTYHLMCTVIGFLMSDFISCFTVSFFDISQTVDCQNKQEKINFNPPVIKKSSAMFYYLMLIRKGKTPNVQNLREKKLP